MNFHDLVLVLHILGAGVLVGVVVFSFVLAVVPPLTVEKVNLIDRLTPFGKFGSAWQLLTGLYLAGHSWSDIKSLTIFWLKIGLFVAAGLIIEFLVRRQAHLALEENNPKAAKLLLAGSILLVVVIILIVTIGVILVEHH